MSNRRDCPWCGFSYADVKQGREYLKHCEPECEQEWMSRTLQRLLAAPNDHMTACDKVMGATHPCTCGADKAREVLAKAAMPVHQPR